ncbi:MAG: phenylpyruvate tautomerase MIF-related protein [Cyanobacteriota bacterium]
MPLLKIQTSSPLAQSAAQTKDLLTALSQKLSRHLGKPESYVMTCLEPNAQMTFAGTFDPVCYLEVKSIGAMTPQQTKAISKDFCEVIHQVLQVAPNRIYIEFADAKGAMWGHNGGTF